jgi:hypothetical protein
LKERYRLERLLGHGGMAAVWLGHDLTLDRPVAVKVLSDVIAADPEFMARFRREAQVAARLSHPNLVDVYDFSDDLERPYLVMEYVPGDDLASRIDGGGPLDCERLALELLQAVGHIHSAGIVHRDIKPQNILLAPGDTLKLIDFGIALPRDAASLTQTGRVLGTERYAAPEVKQGAPADERSDLYSCGVVLRACPGTTPSLAALTDWLTSPDPNGRPRSAKQALARLERRGSVAGATTQEYLPTFARAMPPRGRTDGPEEDRSFGSHRQAVGERPLPPGRPAGAGRPHRARLAAAAAILAVLGATGIALLTAGGGGGGQNGASGAVAWEAHRGPAASGSPASPTATPVSAASGSVPEPEGGDPALGAQLNQEGYELIQAGSYEEAVPVLEESVRAFPAGTEDLEYAYALFNLGHALRLSGRAEEAVPVLERRLEIPDQTEVVQSELDAARSEAG